MDVVTDSASKHRACLEEYRMALRMWSEIRGLYPDPFAPEVLEATKHLEEIEQDLVGFGQKTKALVRRETPKAPQG